MDALSMVLVSAACLAMAGVTPSRGAAEDHDLTAPWMAVLWRQGANLRPWLLLSPVSWALALGFAEAARGGAEGHVPHDTLGILAEAAGWFPLLGVTATTGVVLWRARAAARDHDDAPVMIALSAASAVFGGLFAAGVWLWAAHLA